MRVRAVLIDDDVWLESSDQGRYQLVKSHAVGGIARSGRQRNVDGVATPLAACPFVDETSAREQVLAAFVKGDGQDLVCIVKSGLDSVTVVNVCIEIDQPNPVLPAEMFYGHGPVVVNAEARRVICHGMMETPTNREGMALGAAHDELGRGEGSAYHFR